MQEIKKDCFAYRGNYNCAALKKLYCAFEECKFYKPSVKDERKAKMREREVM